MGRKKTPTSTMNVAEKQNTDLAKRLDGLITDVNALKNYLGISAQSYQPIQARNIASIAGKPL